VSGAIVGVVLLIFFPALDEKFLEDNEKFVD
jgi:hypothetical protein